jgi:hypothetical protein
MSIFKKTIIKDVYGFQVECTPNDELRAIEPVRLVGTQFEGATLDTNFWTSTLAGSGTAAVGSGMLLLTTTITSGASAVVQSVRTARYVGSSSCRFRAQIRVGDTTTTNNKRRWGAFTTGAGSNGCFFEEANGALSVVTRKNNADTAVASASWNGNTTVPTLTNVNTYEIYYNNKRCYFVINGILMHTVTATTATWSDTKTFPVRLENSNTGVGTVETLEAWTATIVRLGKLETKPQYKYITGAATTVCKLSSGHLHRIIVNQAGTLCTIYDQTSGAVPLIGILDTNKTTGTIGTVEYQCPFFNGLTIVTTGGGTDLTVVYE